MKRILAIILSLIILLLLSACQPTPQKATVVQKNSERMIEEAQKSEAPMSTQSLAEQYGIPETYQFQLTSEDGKLNINVDARVDVPEATAIPIYRVKAADFTQEQVDAFWNIFCKDKEMWKTPEQQTRSEIEQSIIYWKKFMKDEGEEDNPDALDRLAQMEKALQTAPEIIEDVRSDGKLETMYWYKDFETKTQKLASYTGIRAYQKKDDGITFMVQNNDDLKEAWIMTNKSDTGGGGRGVQRNAMMMYSDNGNSAAKTNFGYSPSVAILEDSDLNAALLKNIGLKPSEAKKMVQDVLDKAHADAVVDSVYYRDDEQKGYVDDIVRPAEHYDYQIFCVRLVDGIPCAYIDQESRAGEDMMAPSWMYEKIEFRVNAQGIFEMDWWSPLDLIEKVNADAKLKPFSEIQEIFEKMMSIKYEAQSKQLDGLDFEINRVTLSLQRVAEQNSYENGLLVPVWNFYGKQIEHYDDGNANEEFGGSFLSINAIDGSIIDTQKGY